MGCLWQKSCGHCKNLFEAVSCGVCEVTDHKVIKTGDDEFAEDCPYYENRYGYGTSGEPKKKQEGKAYEADYDQA